MKTLIGKKVVLTPLDMRGDMDFFWDTYSENNRKYLYELAQGEQDQYKASLVNEFQEGSFFGWVIYTKLGKKSQKIGVIWCKDFGDHIVEVNGALINKIIRGLITRLRRKKGDPNGYTFSEEALFLVTRYCFRDLNKTRVHAAIDEENKVAIALTKKVGYLKEGTLRKFAFIKDKFMDIAMLSMIKEEFCANDM